MNKVFCIALLCTIVIANCQILLEQVDSISFSNKLTSTRALDKQNQLVCMENCFGSHITLVECYNNGYTFNGIDWHCIADSYYVYDTMMTCEGNLYDEDPLVLENSCVLYYKLIFF